MFLLFISSIFLEILFLKCLHIIFWMKVQLSGQVKQVRSQSKHHPTLQNFAAKFLWHNLISSALQFGQWMKNQRSSLSLTNVLSSWFPNCIQKDIIAQNIGLTLGPEKPDFLLLVGTWGVSVEWQFYVMQGLRPKRVKNNKPCFVFHLPFFQPLLFQQQQFFCCSGHARNFYFHIHF